MRLAETFYKKYMLDHMYTTFTKITYKLSFPTTSLEQLGLSEVTITWAAVLILLPNKTYLAALSLCIFFLSWQMHAINTGFF